MGCDGNASTVRNLVFHDSPVGYSGQAAYRAIIPLEDVPEAIFATPNVLWPGRGAMLLHYPVIRGKTMHVIGIAVKPAWQVAGWAMPTEPAEVQTPFAEFTPHAHALLAASGRAPDRD